VIARSLGPFLTALTAGAGVALALVPSQDVRPVLSPSPSLSGAPADTSAPGSAWLALLSDGPTKRRFILDCSGCHVFDAEITRVAGAPRSRESWEATTAQMLLFAGATTSFPIISPDRDAAQTAEWLASHLGEKVPRPASAAVVPEGFEVVEYPLPRPDLPHDIAIAADGRIIMTGMMTGVLYALDPSSAEFAEISIPVPEANPRAIEVTPDGSWWIVLGGPAKIARHDPRTGEWRHWDVGLYAHEAAIDSSGRVWYNGHFTKSPEILGVLDPATGTTRRFEVPSPPMENGGSTIPYGLRVGRDGTVWMTQLLGNRLVRFDPRTESFTLYDLPTPHSGPRRLDVDAAGRVWIPEFANDRLALFSPETETFIEHVIPTDDALPYVARVDSGRNVVWLGTAAGNLVARFDMRANEWIEIPLPTHAALVRHLAVDARTGDVWGAYGPFPVVSPKVFVIRAR
jgi:streptogramin lyase